MLPLIIGSYFPKNTSSLFSTLFKTWRITNKTEIIKDFEMPYHCKANVILFFLTIGKTDFDSII